MNRRTFIESLGAALALGGILILAGCDRKETSQRLGNQETLWKIATGKEPNEVPLELSYAKDTPAIFRDASLGKADGSLPPKIGGG